VGQQRIPVRCCSSSHQAKKKKKKGKKVRGTLLGHNLLGLLPLPQFPPSPLPWVDAPPSSLLSSNNNWSRSSRRHSPARPQRGEEGPRRCSWGSWTIRSSSSRTTWSGSTKVPFPLSSRSFAIHVRSPSLPTCTQTAELANQEDEDLRLAKQVSGDLNDWLGSRSGRNLHCDVSDPQIVRKYFGLKAVEYTVATPSTTVKRRFRDFVALREGLETRFPGAVIPPLPPTPARGKHMPKNLNKRRLALQFFLRAILKHPYLSDDDLVVEVLFLFSFLLALLFLCRLFPVAY